MAKFGYSIIGMKELQTKIDRLVALSVQHAKVALDSSADIILDTAGKQIQTGSRSGKTYTKGGKTGQRSRAGEWPKSDNETLVKNIFKDEPAKLSVRVGSSTQAKHGKWLEFGTSRMGARPWLARSFAVNRKGILHIFEKNLKRVKP